MRRRKRGVEAEDMPVVLVLLLLSCVPVVGSTGAGAKSDRGAATASAGLGLAALCAGCCRKKKPPKDAGQRQPSSPRGEQQPQPVRSPTAAAPALPVGPLPVRMEIDPARGRNPLPAAARPRGAGQCARKEDVELSEPDVHTPDADQVLDVDSAVGDLQGLFDSDAPGEPRVGDTVSLAPGARVSQCLAIGDMGTVVGLGPSGTLKVRGPRGHVAEMTTAELQRCANEVAVAGALSALARLGKLSKRLLVFKRAADDRGRRRQVLLKLDESTLVGTADAHIAPAGAVVQSCVGDRKELVEIVELHDDGSHTVRRANGDIVPDLLPANAATAPRKQKKYSSPTLLRPASSPESNLSFAASTSMCQQPGCPVLRAVQPYLGLRAAQGQWYDRQGARWKVVGQSALRESLDGGATTATLVPTGEDSGLVRLKDDALSTGRGSGMCRVGPGLVQWEDGALWRREPVRECTLSAAVCAKLVQWPAVEYCCVGRTEPEDNCSLATEDVVMALDGVDAVRSDLLDAALSRAELEGRQVRVAYCRPASVQPASELLVETVPAGSQAEAVWGGQWLPCTVLSAAGRICTVQVTAEACHGLGFQHAQYELAAVAVRSARPQRSQSAEAILKLREAAFNLFAVLCSSCSTCPPRADAVHRRPDSPMSPEFTVVSPSAQPLLHHDPAADMDRGEGVESLPSLDSECEPVVACFSWAELLYVLRTSVSQARTRLKGLKPGKDSAAAGHVIDVDAWMTWVSRTSASGGQAATKLLWIAEQLQEAGEAVADDLVRAAALLRPPPAPAQPLPPSPTAAMLPVVHAVVDTPGRAKVAPPQAGMSFGGAIVREHVSLTSAEVGALRPEQLCDVAEVRDRRARLAAPLRGWVSVMTVDGDTILAQCPPDELPPNTCVLVKLAEEKLGMSLNKMVVSGVAPEGASDRAGCAAYIGRRLTHVNGMPVVSASEAVSVAAGQTEVRLLFEEAPSATVVVRKYHDHPLPCSFDSSLILMSSSVPEIASFSGCPLTAIDQVAVSTELAVGLESAGKTSVELTFQPLAKFMAASASRRTSTSASASMRSSAATAARTRDAAAFAPFGDTPAHSWRGDAKELDCH
eukprot:TRINITY_DN2678_c0_g1_i1.p1 TRINITY_DN2678_c0_g1~~TRINITY_DN2678_c0_g1_i1.p1  ORF type:complete len:1098 (+),score=297.69 TRINITY_DN2678_c0_g1_i1:55-3348(+)